MQILAFYFVQIASFWTLYAQKFVVDWHGWDPEWEFRHNKNFLTTKMITGDGYGGGAKWQFGHDNGAHL